MHVVLVSNCEKAALSRTRAIVDRYATRIAERAWATRMTQDALDELHGALRRRASRHTSVACYRSDTSTGLRLVWIVGNRDAYDASGGFAVATRRTKRDLAMPLRHAALVARLAGYVHDFGKASLRFLGKLQDSCTEGLGDRGDKSTTNSQKDKIRHEWLSAWLFRHVLSTRGSNDKILTPDILVRAWSEMSGKESDPRDGPASQQADPPVATPIGSALDAAAWAICTHHGAMGGGIDQPLDGSRHVRPDGVSTGNLQLPSNDVFAPVGDPEDARRWADLFASIDRTVRRLRDIDRPAAYWEGVMLMARAALILADHTVSSGTFPGKDARRPSPGILYANTKDASQEQCAPAPSLRKQRNKEGAPRRFLDQPLSWHLQTVGDTAQANMRMIAGEDLPVVDPKLVEAVLAHRSSEESRFAWQDRAADHVRGLPGAHLIFNVASTGSGKTLANLKIAFSLRPRDARLAVAFNLRSLTAQTFAAFGKHLAAIDRAAFERDFACLLGDRGPIPRDVSVQDEDDIDAEDDIDLVGAADLALPAWIAGFAGRRNRVQPSADDKLIKLIASPVLVSTMDWIVAAGEPGQQSRHAQALIRVANSDLILDEVDSFDVRASVAVMRVVQTAAMFGRNVIVSSATLSPALADGLCLAYAKGREVHDALFGPAPWHMTLASDRFEPNSLTRPEPEQAQARYRETLREASRGQAGTKPTKRYHIVDVPDAAAWHGAIAEEAAQLHENNAQVPDDLRCRLSIGLIRVANIQPCLDLAQALVDDGRFVVTAYHAQDVLQRRAYKERRLDRILDRNTKGWIDVLKQELPWLEERTDDVRLIVVATPVEEVGRDHDFDWAIIEPSSMHSIIQTAGRVNRHRRRIAKATNVCVLSRNMRDLRGKPIAFERPGLETRFDDASSSHPSHDMRDLLRPARDGAPQDDALDAGLVFDEGGRQTRFAQYDEAAIRHHIRYALPVIERVNGRQTHFMAKDFEDRFPLRDGSPRIVYALDPDHSRYFLDNDPRKPAGNLRDKTGEKDLGDARTRMWLVPDLQTLQQGLDGAGHARLMVERANDASHATPIQRIDVTWHGVAFG